MKFKNNSGEILDTASCETSLFIVAEISSGFSLSWQPHALKQITAPRYKAWFSAIDLVRRNAEVTVNARANTNSPIELVGQLIHQSVAADIQINHAVNQCFWETGLA